MKSIRKYKLRKGFLFGREFVSFFQIRIHLSINIKCSIVVVIDVVVAVASFKQITD